MLGYHPYDCAIRKFPMNCRYCGQLVVYWECCHGSKVFFDPPDRGDHRYSCSAMSGASANPSPPRESGKIALTTMSDVSVGVQPDDYGLMPDTMRVADVESIAALRRSWAKMPEPSGRDTVAMLPYGDKSETVVGEISDIFEIDLAAKFNIPPNSIGARMLGETFPGLRAAQITILVDDFLNDPDAVDKMSYTAWCPTDAVPRGLAKRTFVTAEISPREFPGIGRKWLVK